MAVPSVVIDGYAITGVPAPAKPTIVPTIVIDGYAISGAVASSAPGATLVIDGMLGTSFYFALTTDVASIQVQNLKPGEMYTVEFRQSATGENLAWPANILEPPMWQPKPGERVVLVGVGLFDGSLLTIKGWAN